jgi:transcriptional regulator of acetoin/glycerol metabolism
MVGRELADVLRLAAIRAEAGIIRPEHLEASARPKRGRKRERLTLAELVRRRIDEALVEADGNGVEAARSLGIDRTTLWRKLRARGGRRGSR